MGHGDAQWMKRALSLARAALGSTAPNPAVGAVLVRDGQTLGEGWTRPVGGDHAEVVAIADARSAGHDLAGATAYVTLEPCCHQGRTPPCTDALLAAGVTRVVVGTVDPFPKVQGQGIAQLRAAGVDVVVGVERDACERQILGFARALCDGLPEVTSKAAVSADGNIATASGESKWITGPLAREDGHRLRASHDAILVGIATILADDPRLNCRLPKDAIPAGHAIPRDPVPVILDTHLRIPADAQVFAAGRRALVICGPDAPDRELPAEVVRVALGPDGRVSITEALRAAASAGLHRVLVEGGGTVHRSVLDAGLVDTLHLYVAGVVVPGGRSWVGGPPLDKLGDARRMELSEVRRLGNDARLTWQVVHDVAPDPLAPHR